MSQLPVILGGKHVFRERIQMVRPVLPDLNELSEDLQRILSSGVVTKGKYLESLEAEIARHLGVKYAIAVSSCTSGLMLTYQGLGLSGEVIVPSFTFMATVSALVWNGLRPVFVDVDPGTTNLDPDAVEVAITPRTSAIVAIHNFGNPAHIDALQALADRHGIKLIFDAAHGFGALYKGVPVGRQGAAQVFSLSPTKLLVAGEGGVVATNDDSLADKVRIGREYGNSGRYDTALPGLNARMPEINALLGLSSLKRLENAAESRNETAEIFHEGLGGFPGIHFQVVETGNRNSYKDFSITIDARDFGLNRDQLAVALSEENVDTRKYYQPPVHRQTAYQRFSDGSSLPNTDWLAENSLSIPIWTNMRYDIAMGICEAIQRVYNYRMEIREKISTI